MTLFVVKAHKGIIGSFMHCKLKCRQKKKAAYWGCTICRSDYTQSLEKGKKMYFSRVWGYMYRIWWYLEQKHPVCGIQIVSPIEALLH